MKFDPFSAVTSKIFGAAALVLLLAAGLGWWRADHWHGRFDTLNLTLGTIVVAIREASDNPTVTAGTAAEQVRTLGASRRSMIAAIETINTAVSTIANETQRLKARRQLLEREAARAIAQRDAARRRLADATSPPAVRRDCEQLAAEAEAMLDLLRKEGF